MTATPSRWPVTAVFFLNGLLLSSYIVRVPAIKSDLHLTAGQLGLTGTLFAGAAIVAMQFVGPVAARVGSARLIRFALVAMPLTVAAIGLSRGLVAFAVAAIFTGAVHGSLDVAMNAYAVAVEQARRRPILSGCHAAWSISAVAASLVAGGLIKAGVSTAAHLLGAAAAVAIAGAAIRLTPIARPAAAQRAVARRSWSKTDVLFGLTGTVLMVCEGAFLTWTGVFLHDVRSASLATASLAVTAYTGSQTVGRVAGDRLNQRLGPQLLFRFGGLLGAAALVAVVLVPAPAAAIVALGVVGLAAANMIPMAFSAAGRTRDPQDAAVALARFTTFTYSGILVGPGLIGWIAQGVGLTAALLGLVPLMAAVALAGLRVSGRDRRLPDKRYAPARERVRPL